MAFGGSQLATTKTLASRPSFIIEGVSTVVVAQTSWFKLVGVQV